MEAARDRATRREGARARRERRRRAEARLRLALARDAAALAGHRGGPPPPASAAGRGVREVDSRLAAGEAGGAARPAALEVAELVEQAVNRKFTELAAELDGRFDRTSKELVAELDCRLAKAEERERRSEERVEVRVDAILDARLAEVNVKLDAVAVRMMSDEASVQRCMDMLGALRRDLELGGGAYAGTYLETAVEAAVVLAAPAVEERAAEGAVEGPTAQVDGRAADAAFGVDARRGDADRAEGALAPLPAQVGDTVRVTATPSLLLGQVGTVAAQLPLLGKVLVRFGGGKSRKFDVGDLEVVRGPPAGPLEREALEAL